MLNFGLNKFCHFNENLEFFSPSVQLLHHIHEEHFTAISWKVAGIWDIPSRCWYNIEEAMMMMHKSTEAQNAEAQKHQQRRINCHKKSKKKTTTNSLTTNVPPTSMINVDDCVLSRGAIIEPVAVGSRRCVEPLLHDRGDGHNHNWAVFSPSSKTGYYRTQCERRRHFGFVFNSASQSLKLQWRLLSVFETRYVY